MFRKVGLLVGSLDLPIGVLACRRCARRAARGSARSPAMSRAGALRGADR